jgi:hypothetical protein
MFTEAEYTKENEREVYAQLARQGASGTTPTVGNPSTYTDSLADGHSGPEHGVPSVCI